MSSPVSKLRHFSRIFSAKSLKSADSCKLASPGLVHSPGLPALPDGNIRAVATPSTTRSPAHCSTPMTDSSKVSMIDDSAFGGHGGRNSSKISKVRSKLAHISPYKYLAHSSARKRHFGVSDASITAARSKAFHRHNESMKSGGHRSFNKSTSGKCSVFSTSVVPCVSPRRDTKSRILRLSGISLSPTSVSWSSQSPVQVRNNRTTSPTHFRYHTLERKPHTGKRLQNPTEQCPPGKLYFWEEDQAELITEEQLGRGGFGQVFEGLYRGQKVAIKKLERAFKPRQALLETLQGEMYGLRLCHPNIVRTLVVIQPIPSSESKTVRNSCYIVMEHAGVRNLSQLINNGDEDIPALRRYRFSCDILSGLAYLHNKSLAHLDLKPSNVIVTSEDTCKLCDFGSCFPVASPNESTNDGEKNIRDVNMTSSSDSMMSSSMLSAHTSSANGSSAKSSSQLMGTFIYRAPELLRGYQATTKADMFSFSITAWQLWSRVLPYSGQHNHAAVFAVVAFGARPAIPQFSSSVLTPSEKSHKKYFELLACCWNADPTLRPNAEQALTIMKTCLETSQ